jgi:hypothetical protein
MKLFKNISLLFTAFIFILNTGCKKFPDGPLIDFHSKKDRIAGVWDVEYFSINGYDSTSYLKNQLFYGMYSLSPEEKYEEPVASYDENTGFGAIGYWNLQGNKKNLDISFTYSPTKPQKIGPYRAESVTWEIRRLKERELWLKTIYEGKEYFVKFKLYKDY